MVRVLHIVNSLNRGGLETTLVNILRNIDRNKVMFDFLMHTSEECHYNEEVRSLGSKIYSIEGRRAGPIKYKNNLDKFFKEHPEYDIIHYHVSSLTNVSPLIAAKNNGVPVRIVHSRNTQEGGSGLHKYLHLLHRRNIKNYATHYFACSDLAAKWLFGEKQYNAGECVIINNGIETERFVFNLENRNMLRQELKINDQLVLGNVGRFHHQKNHKFLVDIFYEVQKIQPNSVLLLIGDGELKGEIEQHIKEKGLSDKVIFTGVRSDIPNLLQAMDIFVMPSFHEGLPGTIVEAQGAGLPCLLSDTITKQVGITDLVQFMSLNDSANDWCKKIIDMTTNFTRRNTSEELKQAGYDMKSISKKLEEFYCKL
ncbi:MAG: glycosyltransferase family 1 protein [Oscillospiraceae bacterium]